MSVVYLIIGLGLILWGANALTDGASAVAKRFGVSDLVIGLTVIAIGTSMPEFTISMLSAIQGNSELAIGNVVGSNIINILAIVGITAMVAPIAVERNVISNEIPLLILSSVVLLAMGNAPLLDGAPGRILTRVDGIILLIFFAIFMRYVISQARKPGASADTGEVKEMKIWKAVLFIVLGLAALVGGGKLFVNGASAIAKSLGVSDAVIGLTIVALGTSLPELATAIVSALKKKPGLVIGNVVGSNIFNVFLILGCSATCRQLPFGAIGNLDLLTLTGASLLFWFVAYFFKNRTITRLEGALMFAAYIAYTVMLIMQAPSPAA